MIFRSPSNAQTKLAENDGTPVLFWRNWFNAVAQWLTEASTVQRRHRHTPRFAGGPLAIHSIGEGLGEMKHATAITSPSITPSNSDRRETWR